MTALASALSKPCLVLNKNWQAVHVTTVMKALKLVFKNSARIVDVNDYQTFTWDDWSLVAAKEGETYLSSANFRLKVPEVITLTGYDKVPTKSVTFSRRNIFKRDRYQCQYCGTNPGSDELTIDHIVPRAQGGTSTWTNCCLACVSCNAKKRDRTPKEAGMVLRSNPAAPVWKPAYSNHNVRLNSWKKFISEVYWNTSLES